MYRKLHSSRLMRSTRKMNRKTLAETLAVERESIDLSYPLLGAAFGATLALGTAHKYFDFKALILREKLEGAKAKLEQSKEEREAKKRPETSL
ncbi:hypothetical protein RHGRI_003530 [Rhododendron griersonianum]|uniref:ATP synthase protein MI25 n=1 Tax=Rhododendron griersonianum TaxID=479676 RepID=A0AAV6L768_9ERIC|nr:hypothetical protein RHGRI_003530 [Rhododendron griersonianum]